MISSNLLKTGALLCIISLSSISRASLPANDPLHAKLAAIDAMSEEDLLCAVAHTNRDLAERLLENSKTQLIQNKHNIPEFFRSSVQLRRLNFKQCATENELEACNDPERRQKLIDKKNQFYVERVKHSNEEIAEANKLLRGSALSATDAYNHAVFRACAFSDQATILRAQKEDENKALRLQKEKLEQEKTQWQQEKQAFITEINNLNLFIDGPQREGIPNVPGGIQPQEGAVKNKSKRSNSCER